MKPISKETQKNAQLFEKSCKQNAREEEATGAVCGCLGWKKPVVRDYSFTQVQSDNLE